MMMMKKKKKKRVEGLKGLITPKLVSEEFISVQPMALPSGKIWHMDFVVKDDKIGMNDELWLEDGGHIIDDEGFSTGETSDDLYHCPEIANDEWISDWFFARMKWGELVFDKWEIESYYMN